MTATAPNRWYFDPLSPFACLQWPKIKALRRDVPITPVPILLAADVEHRGTKVWYSATSPLPRPS